ncbi:Leucine Rich Repeat [Seminavis robusta]|uniref:Leucine Rich Repeat n=1 Tax=Seminavis robusta TaxID=568900 RepID=A0A9N8HG74_9STRA|nr:Leucine Rich Repeat [Seminavis robusta]|eukprot:Sro469_g149290.1 Leucine Rich Repeat (736) ;mRNA; f:15337-17629
MVRPMQPKPDNQKDMSATCTCSTDTPKLEYPDTVNFLRRTSGNDIQNRKCPSEHSSDDGGKKDPSELQVVVERPQKPKSTGTTSLTPHTYDEEFLNDVIDEIEHLPLSRTTGTSTTPARLSRTDAPGAVAISGDGLNEQHSGGTGTRTRIGPVSPFSDHITRIDINYISINEELAEASLVEELELQKAVPESSNHAADSTRKREESNKKIKTSILIGVLSLLSVLIIVLTVTVPGKDKSTTLQPTVAPSQAPYSQAPTTFEASILALFPDSTVQSITENPGSPQSRAWHWLLEDMALLSYTNEYIVQKFALATLYYATGGDNNSWTSNDHWLDHSVNPCNWFNQPDFSSKFVVNQYYPGYLAGFLEPLPEWHCNEDGMYQHLWLDSNNLVGTLPEEFYLLTTLVSFSAAFSAMQGTISTEIGKLTALEGFVISNQKDGGVIPSEIGLLTNLAVLALRDCGFHGTIPTEIWQLTKLQHFGLNNNPRLDGTIASEIGNFHSLRWLIMDQGNLHGSIPSEMGILPSLEWLALGKNQLTGTLGTELGLLSRLELLSIFDNLLDGTLPTELGELTASFLQTFWGNQLTGHVPSELGRLTELTITLNFHSNFFSGTIPTELGLLSLLHELEFQGNVFTGRIPSEFGQLSSIGHLTFANNSLSGQLPTELSSLQSTLHTLPLQGNPMLSGTIPDGVCNMNGTCVSSAHDRCNPVHLSGLSFDCSDLLCGCGCSCQGGNTSRT